MDTVEVYENWTTSFEGLRCLHLGADTDESRIIARNSTYGYEVKLLSHVCLNGSLSHLSYDDWNARCFPSYADNVSWRRAAGIWAVCNFVIGILGNLLTMVSVAYARAKHR